MMRISKLIDDGDDHQSEVDSHSDYVTSLSVIQSRCKPNVKKSWRKTVRY